MYSGKPNTNKYSINKLYKANNININVNRKAVMHNIMIFVTVQCILKASFPNSVKTKL